MDLQVTHKSHRPQQPTCHNRALHSFVDNNFTSLPGQCPALHCYSKAITSAPLPPPSPPQKRAISNTNRGCMLQ